MTGSGSSPGYDVFISYRREGGAVTALFLREKLMRSGLRVFLDVSDLRKGYFDDELLRQIDAAPNFLVILSPKSLERCESPEDWLRKEIAQAIHSNRNIIPLMMDGFEFPAVMAEDIRSLRRHQGVVYSHIYHEAMVGKILESIEAEKAERERRATAETEAMLNSLMGPPAEIGPPISTSTVTKPIPTAATKTEELQERVLDAAMAKQVNVGRPTELTVMIRRTDSEGLKAVLQVEESDARPEDVRSKPFELEFPLDARGQVGAAEVILRVEAPDFDPPMQAKKLRVPPKADSEAYSYLLTAKRAGDLRVNLELCRGEICVASRVLRTSGEAADRAVSDEKVLVSMPLAVRGVERKANSPTFGDYVDAMAPEPLRSAERAHNETTPVSMSAPSPRATPEVSMRPSAQTVGSSGGHGERGPEIGGGGSPRASVPMQKPAQSVKSSIGWASGDAGRTLREMFGVGTEALNGKRIIGFVVGMLAIEVAMYVAFKVRYAGHAENMSFALIRAILQAAVILLALRFLKKLSIAALAAGFGYMVLLMIGRGLEGRSVVLPQHLPVFIETIFYVLILGYFVKKIERVWLALFVGTTLGFLAGMIAEDLLLFRELLGVQMVPQAISLTAAAATFATVFVVITRGSWRKS